MIEMGIYLSNAYCFCNKFSPAFYSSRLHRGSCPWPIRANETNLGRISSNLDISKSLTLAAGLASSSNFRKTTEFVGGSHRPMLVAAGMVAEVSADTPAWSARSNAYTPILVTESGMVTEASDLHPLNAPVPILVTELGMLTEVSAAQLENAPSPMLVTESGMVTEVSA